MDIIIPPILETRLTGYAGTVERRMRGVAHSVRFVWQAGELCAMPFRNGVACDWSAATRRLYEAGRQYMVPVPSVEAMREAAALLDADIARADRAAGVGSV